MKILVVEDDKTVAQYVKRATTSTPPAMGSRD